MLKYMSQAPRIKAFISELIEFLNSCLQSNVNVPIIDFEFSKKGQGPESLLL